MITEAIDFRYLLLENYRKLKLNEQELATIFMIDHLISQGNPFVTADLLSLKMTLGVREIDEISNYSHNEKGYKETKKGEIISYAYAKDIEL